MWDIITWLYELLSVYMVGLLVVGAFIFGVAVEHVRSRKLFKKYEGVECSFTSSENSYEAWDKIINFVIDRVKLVHEGAILINPPDYTIGSGMDIERMSELEIYKWLRESNCGAFVYLCNTLGIRIDLSTKEELTEEEMSEEEFKQLSDHFNPYHGKLNGKFYSLLTLILSGGALMSIIAFVLVIVMC